MSKHCHSCQYLQKQPTSLDAFRVWKASHKCEANYEGSSPSMESHGTLELFNWSTDKYNLRYTQVISDGDFKSYSKLVEM